jgi:hypothetical protein
MLAYFVYNKKKDSDVIVLPETGCSVTVDPERFEKFISVNPNFSDWTGDSCREMAPEDFGTVIAMRDDTGDVCVTKEEYWQQRMFFYMSGANRGIEPKG